MTEPKEPNPVSDDYQVKGSSISSKFDFVRERSGPAEESRLRELFSDDDRLFPILDSAWAFEFADQRFARGGPWPRQARPALAWPATSTTRWLTAG